MADPSVSVSLDTTAIRRETTAVAGLARGMGAAFTSAFREAIFEAESFGGVLRNLALRISELSLTAAFRPVESFLGNVLTRGFSGLRLPAGTTAATTGVVSSAGRIAAPSYLPRAPSAAAAPAMAASPLAAAASPAGSTPSPRGAPQITVNIATPDPESFRRSEAQVSAALARAVARGNRSL